MSLQGFNGIAIYLISGISESTQNETLNGL